MRVQVKQWGNSKAIRFPKDFTNSVNLNMGDIVELKAESPNTITLVIIPNKPAKKRLTLSERIAKTNLNKLPIIKEWDLLTPAGKEI
ncbi:AbrB/MazE/SpoVT family DNA-binding domain-containing protein [Aggregatibacter actinomycetemcomitans]|uniref:AbrB/MazE/SpoVT family DNA-binding domain-containing protein n=1 Tax=Aggregatibacter actinomycetemcomitans TaxID=714 RepID=UPI00197BE745|nr:antitoxin MazE [Aggregatibacter actinomycetemcomitans]MBN6059377.1 antitoxin MazE [Aggregatibacter actinomycetemcomitans]MBN6087878.1 antitoxin MazE [Aggregatibacter actinomycetemcomitans]